MGTYTSKYTGEQIDELLGRVENDGGSGYSETILYESSTSVSAGANISLTDSVNNYKQILVETCCDGATSTSICKHIAIINSSSIIYSNGTNETYSVREDSGATSSVSFYRLYYGFADDKTIKMIAVDHKDWKNGRISRVTGIKF